MSGALLFLAMHPEAQEKVVQELNSVFETAEETVENDHLIELVYLEMVIKETMRLLPVLPIIGRCTTAEVQLSMVNLNHYNKKLLYMYIIYFQRITLFLIT